MKSLFSSVECFLYFGSARILRRIPLHGFQSCHHQAFSKYLVCTMITRSLAFGREGEVWGYLDTEGMLRH